MIDDSVGMKARVEEVLNSTGYSEQRAAKMTIDDLLKYVVDESEIFSDASATIDCYLLSMTKAYILRNCSAALCLQKMRIVDAANYVHHHNGSDVVPLQLILSPEQEIPRGFRLRQ